MSCDPPQWFDRVFTAPRLLPYQDAARRAGAHAEDLYRWNLQASEAFYPALSCLEICLRNALDEQLRVRYDRTDWWTSAPLAFLGYIEPNAVSWLREFDRVPEILAKRPGR